MEIRKNIVADKFRAIAEGEEIPTPTFHYFSPARSGNPRNAFLFEREDILKIFFPKNVVDRILVEDIKKGTPTHLVAILGAHNQTTSEFFAGQSTVIVMGVKPKDGGSVIDLSNNAVNVPVGSLDSGNVGKLGEEDEIVGFEYPPSDGLLQPPPPLSPSPMEFKFTI